MSQHVIKVKREVIQIDESDTEFSSFISSRTTIVISDDDVQHEEFIELVDSDDDNNFRKRKKHQSDIPARNPKKHSLVYAKQRSGYNQILRNISNDDVIKIDPDEIPLTQSLLSQKPFSKEVSPSFSNHRIDHGNLIASRLGSRWGTLVSKEKENVL
jgi:hypothetical protein